ncbi:MAG TPA: hypothetical protein VF250_13460 [Conexibacter sp.]
MARQTPTRRETSSDNQKTCFVVSEFGTDEKTRIERKQMLKHLVKKVLEPMGYDVQRADDIDDLGQITHQIIERLLDDDLVIADLTGLNPNVFYELAVRHAARRPVITLMTFGEDIPFDLKDVRTVFYDLHDPDKLETAQEELEQKVRAIEENSAEVRNPITVARNVTLLQQSDDPEQQATGALLSTINEMRDEMRLLARSVSSGSSSRRDGFVPATVARKRIRTLFEGDGKFTTDEVIDHAEAPPRWVETRLQQMLDQGTIFRIDGKWTSVPF